jgi:hypothetical protein
MKTIKIFFIDFSSDFNIQNDVFYKWISQEYNINIDNQNPDYVIYSCYGNDYLKYDNAIRIFYTAENIFPDFNLCDYAIGFNYLDFGDRYLRFPSFARYGEQFEQLTMEKKHTAAIFKTKTSFCNFIYTNGNSNPIRDKFFHLLNSYKKVDSLGGHLKNCDAPLNDRYSSDWRLSKVEIQSNYKFSIAFENSKGIGYTTEKILHAFIANTVPIYWGNPEICKDFNKASFINCNDYKSLEDLVEKVIELNNNEEAYLKMLNQPPFIENIMPLQFNANKIKDFFGQIFNKSITEAYRRPRHGTTVGYENRLNHLLQIDKRFNKLNRILNKFKQYGKQN